MKGRTTVAVVVGGYIAALVVGAAAVALRSWMFPLPPAEASGGMAGFGDLLFFGLVAGVASLVPSGIALRGLRTAQSFWRPASFTVLAVAVTGPLAIAIFATESHRPDPSAFVAMLGFFSLMRLFGSPVLTPLWSLSALLCPEQPARRTLFAAAALEALVAATVIIDIAVNVIRNNQKY